VKENISDSVLYQMNREYNQLTVLNNLNAKNETIKYCNGF